MTAICILPLKYCVNWERCCVSIYFSHAWQKRDIPSLNSLTYCCKRELTLDFTVATSKSNLRWFVTGKLQKCSAAGKLHEALQQPAPNSSSYNCPSESSLARRIPDVRSSSNNKCHLCRSYVKLLDLRTGGRGLPRQNKQDCLSEYMRRLSPRSDNRLRWRRKYSLMPDIPKYLF
jgi:hypothetical protein